MICDVLIGYVMFIMIKYMLGFIWKEDTRCVKFWFWCNSGV